MRMTMRPRRRISPQRHLRQDERLCGGSACIRANAGSSTFIPGAGKKLRATGTAARSEEHTSELQSPDHLVCRLLLEKKKNMTKQGRQQTADRIEYIPQ